MSALIAALICSGNSGHAFTTMSRSGSFGASGASCASDFAPPPSEIGVFDTVRVECSNPIGPIYYEVFYYTISRYFLTFRKSFIEISYCSSITGGTCLDLGNQLEFPSGVRVAWFCTLLLCSATALMKSNG